MIEKDYDVQDETFRILDLDKLNWAFRQLASIEEKENVIKNLATSEKERIRLWEEKELKPFNDSREYFSNLIQDYHYHTLLQDPKAKTISTPYGKSKSRVSKAQPAKADDKALLDHILTNDMREFIKEDAIWGEFKKTLSIAEVEGVSVAFDANGQAVPGVVIKPESVSYTVEVT